jgi:RND family efflux transporter MFP subunit
MFKKCCGNLIAIAAWLVLSVFWQAGSMSYAENASKRPQGPPPAPVRVAQAIEETVADQITLVGSTEAIARSVIAAEVAGLVKDFPVREGDFVKKGQLLAKLRSTDLALRLKAAEADGEKVQSNLLFAQKELSRYSKLKATDSIAESRYDQALDRYQSLKQELVRTEAEIELLKDDIQRKKVVAPFAGFVAKEHTQVGEWIEVGGPVVSVVDLGRIRITVDVPERYAVQLSHKSPVRVLVESVSDEAFLAKMSAILPEGDLNARTFPVRVELANPGFKIRSGMEARATFSLGTQRNALLVPKDAIVTAGTNRLVYVVSVEGPIKPGDRVVIRGNERLRPGQPVQILE